MALQRPIGSREDRNTPRCGPRMLVSWIIRTRYRRAVGASKKEVSAQCRKRLTLASRIVVLL